MISFSFAQQSYCQNDYYVYVRIVASEVGKLASKETKVDILVTPAAIILVGVGLSVLCAPAVAGCCAQIIGFACMSYKENSIGGLVSQWIGTSMLQMANIIKNPKTWIPPILASASTAFDWIGLVMICFILPAVLSVIFCNILRKQQWIKENDLKLN